MNDRPVETNSSDTILHDGLLRLLAVKDSDIRVATLEQGCSAVDKGIHIGGAFSSVIPLVALFYGGFIRLNVTDPTVPGQDIFVLSKGHAVASMASIYADLGYFDRSVLANSRSIESILNGHPGPLLPGVHTSTGPLGQGVLVAEGFSIANRIREEHCDVFCLAGDGEMQEGLPWEAVMQAPQRRLDNFCLIVDNNEGQLDNPTHLLVSMDRLGETLSASGWCTIEVDGTDYAPIVAALGQFKRRLRDGRPTAIISHTSKGFGGFSGFLVNHKVTLPDGVTEQEIELQKRRRAERVVRFASLWTSLEGGEDTTRARSGLTTLARRMNLEIVEDKGGGLQVREILIPVRTRRAAVRDKAIRYVAHDLPELDAGKEYSAASVVTSAMRIFARDPRVVSVDSDLSSTSGLQAGVGWVDARRALNVGIAEGNMMCIGEAFAALGYNAWVSTFCPFFDWKVLRRIAIGYQERLESIASSDGWLSEGHGTDLTFLATAPNFETQTNGATHMGNDDALVFAETAHLKIIDVSCPNMLLGVMRWTMEGNRGLLYVRIMRAPSAVIYPNDFAFRFGHAYVHRESRNDQAVIVSSGRGVHEALAAAELLAQEKIAVRVIDMPSVDNQMLAELAGGERPVFFTEQNNGILWSALAKLMLQRPPASRHASLVRINTLTADGEPTFIHSATYEQLLRRFGLSPEQIAASVRRTLSTVG